VTNPVRVLCRLILYSSLSLLPLLGQTAPATFKLGVAPHSSSRLILEQYHPLRVHLEKALGRPVEVITAPDFTEFARRALAGDYDLAITTGHQARLYQTDAGYLPLVTYQADFRSVVIVADKGKVHRPEDLKGTTVIGLSASSLVTLWGQHWLKRVGRNDVAVRYVSAADSVAQLLLSGEGSAGLVSLANFQKLPADVQSQLRILTQSPAMLGRVYLLHPKQAHQLAQVEAALWAFTQTPDGTQYFQKHQLGGYRKVPRRELAAMDPYAEEVRKNLRER